MTIDILPFSFKEYMNSTAENNKTNNKHFYDYLSFGAFPYIATMTKEEFVVESYLEGIYNTIILKDVVKRENINDISMLENIVKVLASNIGSPISTKK
ncbi:MAG: hypothetical protein ACK5KR_01155 [Breznakia sp.]